MNGSAPSPVALVLSAPGAPSLAVREGLESAGLTVVASAEEDLLSARAIPRPALLILDDDRPSAARAATLSRLRAHPVLHGVPLIVVTTDCGIDSFGGAIARGASAFLKKPLEPDELPEAARRLLAWRDGAADGNTRGQPRRPLLLGCDVGVAGGAGRRALIVDVSITGCRLETGEASRPGTAVSVVPRACEDSTEIRLGGSVRWCRRVADSRYAVAVRWNGSAALLARRLFGATAG